MKSSLTMALALVSVTAIGSGAAAAADLPVYRVPTQVDIAVDLAKPANDTWTGFYAGANLGGGFVNSAAGDDRDFSGGIQAGYNQQFDQFVIGAELEGTYTNKLQYHLGSGGVLEQRWSGSAKARAGLAMDNILLFGTLGINAARLEGKGTVTSGDLWHAGLAFGGGVEVAFTEQLTGKLEYTQTRLNNVPSTIGGVGRQYDLVNHAIKAGVNYRF